jgi:hypothetical protein
MAPPPAGGAPWRFVAVNASPGAMFTAMYGSIANTLHKDTYHACTPASTLCKPSLIESPTRVVDNPYHRLYASPTLVVVATGLAFAQGYQVSGTVSAADSPPSSEPWPADDAEPQPVRG